MSDEQQSRDSRPLADEIARAAEARREIALESAAELRREEAGQKLFTSVGIGILATLVGSIVLAVGLKDFGADVTDGYVDNGPVVAMWIGGIVGLVGVLFLVRAVVGWTVRLGMDVSSR